MIQSTRFQQGSLTRVKNKTTPDSWFFRYYEDQAGKRVHRNIRVGTVAEMPHRRDAEKAVHALRAKINTGVRSPETVADAIAHYSDVELVPERKAFSTLETVRLILRVHIAPRWGKHRLEEVRTVQVEEWLQSLPLAPGTRSKIRNVFSAVYNHAIRYEWTTHNPIQKVRASSMRLKEPDVLTPDEFRLLVAELGTRERAMVMLAGSTGLRRSEMFALHWSDICLVSMQVQVTKGVVRSRVGKTKTTASRRPVPLHASVAAALAAWRLESTYREEGDYLFPSVRMNGTQPMFPDMVLAKTIRPAAVRAGIEKSIGWHTFRHSLATNLRALGVDVKVAQELLRHANSRTTLDLYTRAVNTDKRLANSRATDLLLGDGTPENSFVPLRTVDNGERLQPFS